MAPTFQWSRVASPRGAMVPWIDPIRTGRPLGGGPCGPRLSNRVIVERTSEYTNVAVGLPCPLTTRDPRSANPGGRYDGTWGVNPTRCAISATDTRPGGRCCWTCVPGGAGTVNRSGANAALY